MSISFNVMLTHCALYFSVPLQLTCILYTVLIIRYVNCISEMKFSPLFVSGIREGPPQFHLDFQQFLVWTILDRLTIPVLEYFLVAGGSASRALSLKSCSIGRRYISCNIMHSKMIPTRKCIQYFYLAFP